LDSIQTVISKLKLNVLNISTVPESFSSEVYKLNLLNKINVYVKIPFNRDKLYREYRVLQKLSHVISVPSVLDFWEGDEKITGALLLSEINGVSCPASISEQLSFQIGVNHAKIHEVSTSGYGVEYADGFRHLEQDNWRLYIKQNFEKLKGDCFEILNAKLFEKCVVYFDEAYSALPETDGPCLVHMDFRPGNILVDNDKVSGIIDFESARGGSSEIDFTKLNRYFWQTNPLSKRGYIKGYSSIRPLIDLDRVLPFYDFYDAFSAVVWCKKRGLEKNKAFLNESISVLERAVGTRLN
jgi:aminoglycoside phosphotransferase (APT) family kinase protein